METPHPREAGLFPFKNLYWITKPFTDNWTVHCCCTKVFTYNDEYFNSKVTIIFHQTRIFSKKKITVFHKDFSRETSSPIFVPSQSIFTKNFENYPLKSLFSPNILAGNNSLPISLSFHNHFHRKLQEFSSKITISPKFSLGKKIPPISLSFHKDLSFKIARISLKKYHYFSQRF